MTLCTGLSYPCILLSRSPSRDLDAYSTDIETDKFIREDVFLKLASLRWSKSGAR